MRRAVRRRYVRTAMLIGFACLGGAAAAKKPRAPETDSTFAAVIVAEHNAARKAVGAAPLAWSETLAADAAAYAGRLAKSSKLNHSSLESRSDQGENLWTGSTGAYSARDMVGLWLAEKRLFRAGRFPNVSSTGRWFDVGHYSQIIWPRTTMVGCGMASGKRSAYLVCRYAPAGNVRGQKVP